MADVFLSYADENRPAAERLASALETERWSVFWARTTTPGQAFAKVIQKQLKDAGCIVVLWSQASVDSDWVSNEAEAGRRRGVLIPAFIELVDALDIPIPFQHLQAADLTDWTGDQKHPEFKALVAAIGSLVPKAAPLQGSPLPAPQGTAAVDNPLLPPPGGGGLSKPRAPLPGDNALPDDNARLADILARDWPTPKTRVDAVEQFCRENGDPRFQWDAWYLPADPMLGFVEIPAGSFTMGSDRTKDPLAYDDEMPAHTVTLPAFYMARFPVTVAQFKAYLAHAGVKPGDPDCLRGIASHPVVSVSWHEAQAYCNWLTRTLTEWCAAPEALARVLRPSRRADRAWCVTLASEAEWEKAARGSGGGIYPWGAQPDPNRANYDDSGILTTNAVGCFPNGTSSYGVEELSGNVWEWTRSLWGQDRATPTFGYPYNSGDGREDLSARNDVLRVGRGGSFDDHDRYVRAAFRFRYGPHLRHRSLGFRVVVSPVSSES